jgi:hypothetical protein
VGGRWGLLVSATLRPLYLDLVPIVQRAGCDPWPVWTSVENLAFAGFRSLECPALSESLYRLNYSGSLNVLVRDVTTGLQWVNIATLLSRSVHIKRI